MRRALLILLVASAQLHAAAANAETPAAAALARGKALLVGGRF